MQNLDISVGMDLALIDIEGSWKRNLPLMVSTSFHPENMVNLVRTLSTAPGLGLGMKESYFSGYFEDPKEMDKYKRDLLSKKRNV